MNSVIIRTWGIIPCFPKQHTKFTSFELVKKISHVKIETPFDTKKQEGQVWEPVSKDAIVDGWKKNQRKSKERKKPKLEDISCWASKNSKRITGENRKEDCLD